MTLIFVASLILVGFSMAFSATVDEIAQELICTCGCNMLVSACEGTMECTAAADIKDQILAKMNSGQSKEQIIASFVSRHGEKILSSPTKRGFNLTAWVLPFVAIIAGIGMVYVLLKNWASQKKHIPNQASFKEQDKVYLEKIEEELKTFEG
jgi:cytochrome c-type biogenesis protein CcmH